MIRILKAVQRLTRWRYVIGNAASHIVLKHINEHISGLNLFEDSLPTREEVATDLLTLQAFAYEDFIPTDRQKAFWSPLILSLLGTTHLQDTHGWVEVPGLDLQGKCDHGIRGVLALCTVAVREILLATQLTNLGLSA